MEIISFRKALNNIYGWTIKKGELVPPKMDLPSCVKDRIKWAFPEGENGLTFIGTMQSIFAYDEEKAKRDWNMGAAGEWLPVSDDFIKWRDQTPLAELQIAVELIYGSEEDDELKMRRTNNE